MYKLNLITAASASLFCASSFSMVMDTCPTWVSSCPNVSVVSDSGGNTQTGGDNTNTLSNGGNTQTGGNTTSTNNVSGGNSTNNTTNSPTGGTSTSTASGGNSASTNNNTGGNSTNNTTNSPTGGTSNSSVSGGNTSSSSNTGPSTASSNTGPSTATTGQSYSGGNSTNANANSSAGQSNGNGNATTNNIDSSNHSNYKSIWIPPVVPSTPPSVVGSTAANVTVTVCGPLQKVKHVPVTGKFFGFVSTSDVDQGTTDELEPVIDENGKVKYYDEVRLPDGQIHIMGTQAIMSVAVIGTAGARNFAIGGGGSGGGWGQGGLGSSSANQQIQTKITLRSCEVGVIQPVIPAALTPKEPVVDKIHE